MKVRPLGFAVMAAVGVTGGANATTYTLTDLGPGVAYGINNLGQVVGSSGGAVVWNGAHPTVLNILGNGKSIEADGINSVGQVVGYAYYYPGLAGGPPNGYFHATIWNGSTPTDLGTLGSYTLLSGATGINDAGTVVGYSQTATRLSQAVTWTGARVTFLGTLPGGQETFATAINNAGQVVGYTSPAGSNATIATIWNGTTPTALRSLDGGTQSYALGLNNVGQVVGFSDTADAAVHATIWKGGVPIDLGTLGGTNSYAFGINDIGQVVGYSYLPDNLTVHATIWNGATLLDLNTLLSSTNAGWTLAEAYAINLHGQIVGIELNGVGELHAFLLTPVSQTPLPATLPLFAAGLGLLGVLGRCKRDRHKR